MAEIFGQDRRICLSREITKKFEEHRRCSIQEAVAYYEANPVKGEFVIIVEGSSPAVSENSLNSMEIEKHLEHYMNQWISKNDAIKRVAKDRNLDKRTVYNHFCKK